MNIISATIASLLFGAVLFGAMTFGITLPCGIILPSVVGGLIVGVIVK